NGEHLRENQSPVAERSLERVEHELAERRRVVPRGRRGDGVRNRVRNAMRAKDRVADRGEPPCICADMRTERADRRAERGDEPGLPERALHEPSHRPLEAPGRVEESKLTRSRGPGVGGPRPMKRELRCG